jgi:uncharacterized membrane protein YkvA (DUF1232 family)
MAKARELARFLPYCVVLLRRLLRDPRIPRGTKLGLALIVPYLLSPIDLIPDFLPLIGQLDDAALVALALRRVVRRAGPDVVGELWPGSASGLTAVLRLAGVPGQG